MNKSLILLEGIKDSQIKGQQLTNLVKQLPAEHYHTLNRLMHHLHRIQQRADINLMNARNLGVVFGREYSVIAHLHHYSSLSFSDTHALSRPEPRVCRHGWQVPRY